MALSMTEAEYMDTVKASKEALWLRGLIEIFGIIQDSVQIHRYSQNAIHLTKDYMYHKQMKYINMRYQKIR